MTAELCAWADESVRRTSDVASTYFLGAAVIDMKDYEACRESLLALPRKGPKLHWHAADDRLRRRIVSAVESLPAQHVVVVAAPADPGKPERARAKCVERMMHELDECGVTRLIMEARTQSLNQRDMKLLDRLRGSNRVPSRVRLEFGLPSQEPLLWLPDQVLGVFGLAASGEGRWLTERTRERVHRVDITLD